MAFSAGYCVAGIFAVLAERFFEARSFRNDWVGGAAIPAYGCAGLTSSTGVAVLVTTEAEHWCGVIRAGAASSDIDGFWGNGDMHRQDDGGCGYGVAVNSPSDSPYFFHTLVLEFVKQFVVGVAGGFGTGDNASRYIKG